MDVTDEAEKFGTLEIAGITLNVSELEGKRKLLESLPKEYYQLYPIKST